jgi:predicted nucleic acid-binding protein
MAYSVLLDACVLYPASLRDLLIHLTLLDLFQAKWSDRIHEEWIEAVLRTRNDLDRQRLQRTRQLMDRHARDALVAGYEPLIESLELPDKNDRHVLAAAIKAKVDAIVTFNLKDFPEQYVLDQREIEVQHPDEFLVHQITHSAPLVCRAAKNHRASLKNSPKNAKTYLSDLEQCGLPLSMAMLEEYEDLI